MKKIFLLYFVILLFTSGCKNEPVINADSFVGVSSQRLYEKLGKPVKGCEFIAKITNDTELNTTFVGYKSGDKLLVFHIQKDLVMDYHYSHYYSESLYGKHIGKSTLKEVYKKLGFPFAYGYSDFFDNYRDFRFFYKVKPARKWLFFSKKYSYYFLIVTFYKDEDEDEDEDENEKENKILSTSFISIHDFGGNQDI